MKQASSTQVRPAPLCPAGLPAVCVSLLAVCVSLLVALVSADARAAQFVSHGDYQIHYTAFASTLIPPEVAEAQGLVRAENQVVVNISVRKLSTQKLSTHKLSTYKLPTYKLSTYKEGEPVAVTLEGSVTNLLNQMSRLEFVEVVEQKAIYYLAHHRAHEKDTLRFAIINRFEDEGFLPYKLNFVRNF